MTRRFAAGISLLVVACAFLVRGVEAQQTFAVATIRPSGGQVRFERDGKTEVTPGHLLMQDVTVSTCLKWAYGVQQSQIVGPESITHEHFDIEAKADDPATEAQMKLMMRALLADRFKLAFHRENRELKSYSLTVAKGGSKLTPSVVEGAMSRQNSDAGTVVKFMTMQEWGDFLSSVVETPVIDKTGLAGRYDFSLDFSAYVQNGERADPATVLNEVMPAQIGLKLEPGKTTVEAMVVDRVEKPSEN